MVKAPNKPNPKPQIHLLEQGDLFRLNNRPVRADETGDADRVRTVRPVGSEQSIDLFTQREDIDMDFRVSGLPDAVVKQAENQRRWFVTWCSVEPFELCETIPSELVE